MLIFLLSLLLLFRFFLSIDFLCFLGSSFSSFSIYLIYFSISLLFILFFFFFSSLSYLFLHYGQYWYFFSIRSPKNIILQLTYLLRHSLQYILIGFWSSRQYGQLFFVWFQFYKHSKWNPWLHWVYNNTLCDKHIEHISDLLFGYPSDFHFSFKTFIIHLLPNLIDLNVAECPKRVILLCYFFLQELLFIVVDGIICSR